MKILTANRLIDGIAVWWTADEQWSSYLQNADIAADVDAIATLEQRATQAEAANEVVDINLIDVRIEGEQIVPLRLRERIRAAGPTIEYGAPASSARAA